ncbi:MAG: efflux RND transporter periplasmic adaptor subunit [Sulfurospirillum sp.]|nr:efflux RND transporter periplasmic adaptor subunit [Sulfurospirillum sp.]
MNSTSLKARTFKLLAVIIPLLALFIYVVLRSGPLAPVAVTLTTIESKPLTPSIFGIGTVASQYTYKLGPILTGRLLHIYVDVGDYVKTGSVLAEMDPIDLDARIFSQQATLKRADATLKEAKIQQAYARTQMQRYKELFDVHSTSEEIATAKRQDFLVSDISLVAAQEDMVRARADLDVLLAQRNSLRLVSPVDGIVTLRNIDSGTTVVAGQSVVEMIDPKSIWINVRFDQIATQGLTQGLLAQIVLRSQKDHLLQGHVVRLEPKADSVTEELLAKITFDALPKPLPPLGELAEVTVDLPPLPAKPTIPNAAVRRNGQTVGVWEIINEKLHFTPIKLGSSDLNGYVQVLEGLNEGSRIVVYSEKALSSKSRIRIVDKIAGTVK